MENKVNYDSIALNGQINTINNEPYSGYWNGKTDGNEFNGVYQNFKDHTKTSATFQWEDGFKTGQFLKLDNYDFKKISEEINKNIEEKMELVETKERHPGLFDELLWTHNMPLSVFYDIMVSDNDEFHRLKATGDTDDKRLFFRYGVDSQYGDVIFVMKPGFLYRYGKYDSMMNYFFRDRWKIWYKDKEVRQKLKKDANMFSYRIMKKKWKNQYTEYSGLECSNNEWINSWCNMQLELSTDVFFDDVLYVLLPEWINIDNCTSGLDEIIINNLKKINEYNPELFAGQKANLYKKFKYYDTENKMNKNSYYAKNKLIPTESTI